MSDSVLEYDDLSKSEEDLLIDLAKSRASTIAWMKSYDAAVADLTEADERGAALTLENQELRQQVEDLKGEVAYLASQVESYTTSPCTVTPWYEYEDPDGGTAYVF